VSALTSDLRLASRSLRRSPIFAATAILTLALGIGTSTALFTVVHAVLLRPLPYSDPDRLVRIWESDAAGGSDRSKVSAATFDQWRIRARTLDGLVLFGIGAEPTVLGVGDASFQVRQAVVTPNFFSLLGIPPALGREFGRVPDASGPLDGGEIVVSHGLWRRAFGGDPDAIGRPVRLEGVPGTVVIGVMPAGFAFPEGAELWRPMEPSRAAPAGRHARQYRAIGRLARSATVETVRSDIHAISATLDREASTSDAPRTVAVVPLHEVAVGGHRLALMTSFAAVSFVLLVGCANVSNLLLARSVARRGELAIRASLGATRAQLARLLLAETVLLVCIGAASGWALAGVLLPLLVQLAGDALPRATDARLSASALAYSGVSAVVAVLMAGVLPALRHSRVDLRADLGAGGQRSTRRMADLRLQRIIVAGEIAACLVLMVGATLFIQTFARLHAVDLGFDPEHVIAIDARVPIYRTRSPDRWHRLAADTTAVLERLRSVPGVQAAGATRDLPLSGNLQTADITVGDEVQPRHAFYHLVSPGYFRVVGVPVLTGRDFTDEDAGNLARLPDARGSEPREGAVIVNETAARMFWPAGDALGQFLTTSFDVRMVSRRKVVGVVRDARSETLRSAAPAEVYVPYLEDPSFAMTLVVRTALSPDHVVPALRRAVTEATTDMSTANIRMLDDVVGEAIRPSRFNALVVGSFAILSLVLSAVGVFGVVAFGVATRVREVGIRMALGASRHDITRMFLTQAAGPVLVGLALGTAGALSLSRLAESLLFGVSPTDTYSYAAAAFLLCAVVLGASYLPVRRLLRADPARALRG
jgi:putative ABC transport system permease protein